MCFPLTTPKPQQTLLARILLARREELELAQQEVQELGQPVEREQAQAPVQAARNRTKRCATARCSGRHKPRVLQARVMRQDRCQLAEEVARPRCRSCKCS
jgi:hypothetical protein